MQSTTRKRLTGTRESGYAKNSSGTAQRHDSHASNVAKDLACIDLIEMETRLRTSNIINETSTAA